MRTITVRLKTGEVLTYQAKDDSDGLAMEHGALRIQGWHQDYNEQETDSGIIRTVTKETRVVAVIPAENLAYYEITI